MNKTDLLKQQAAKAALQFIEADMNIGIGMGSTVNFLIQELGSIKHRLGKVVSSAEQSSALLRQQGIEVEDLNHVGSLDICIDGADEIDPYFNMIKGGGGALTREKIVAAASGKFICIADSSKRVDYLGRFGLPVEVIPMARSLVARQLAQFGGSVRLRPDFVTDNGNVILDIHGLTINQPVELERQIQQLTGVVCVGLFAARGADVLVCAEEGGVQIHQRPR